MTTKIKLPANIGKAEVNYRQAFRLLFEPKGFIESYDFTLNPYSGCTFGCSYCYAAFFTRSKADQDNWGRYVTVKKDSIKLMRQLRRGFLNGKTIYMSSVTDPYQPVERQLGLVRRLLEIMVEQHPRVKLTVQTRSPLATRDIDLFQAINDAGGAVNVNMTVTTDDDDVRRAFEPTCPHNRARLRAISEIAQAGIMTHITMTPLLLVSDVDDFVDQLLETSVQRFITQPLRLKGSGVKFVASTRDDALRVMAEKLGCPTSRVANAYMAFYTATEATLRRRLPHLGIGKSGFQPPF